LPNRRFTEMSVQTAWNEFHVHKEPFGILMVDLDGFKTINDSFGHSAGDRALQQVAQTLSHCLRPTDTVGRWGGDEFLAILPECPPEQIEAILNRLRPIEVEYGAEKIPVTFSTGWVGYETGESVEQFLDRADRTLYLDKRQSKVVVPEVAAAL